MCGHGGYRVSTTFPTFLRSMMKRCAAGPSSSGNASATTGGSCPASIHSLQRIDELVERALRVPDREHVQADDRLRDGHLPDDVEPAASGRASSAAVGDVALLAADQRRCAERDEAPAGAQQRVAVLEALAADRVHDEVERLLLARDPADLLDDVLRAVVDRVVDAEPADRVVLGRPKPCRRARRRAACPIWVAAMPTPPAAAWRSTRSPGQDVPVARPSRRRRSRSSPGKAAPSSKLQSSGSGKIALAGRHHQLGVAAEAGAGDHAVADGDALHPAPRATRCRPPPRSRPRTASSARPGRARRAP